jgi:site-specific DNA-methyltransferase (cytosine-N4-specific)
MKKINYQAIESFIASDVVAPFYNKRIEKLEKIKMKDVMKRKNPYLFKAKNIQTAGDLVKYVLDAYISSQEETIFGDLLESLAIHINEGVFGGVKAEEIKFKSVDLIFERDNKIYLVGIKSGPNWGNSDQMNAMKKNFKKAKLILKEEGVKQKIIGVNGCIYGRDNNPFKKHKVDATLNYYKFCGQEFWSLISGDKELYRKLIEPLDKEVQKKDDHFKKVYTGKINEMTKDLIELFYTGNNLDWDKIVKYVSKTNKK